MRVISLLTLLLVSCGDDDEPAEEATTDETREETQEQASDPSRYLVLADARRLTEPLVEGSRSQDVESRRSAMLAATRLHDPGALDILRRGLRDPDPAVRRHASLGLGAFEDEAPEGVEQSLLAALAAEEDAETRVAMLWDLGRVGTEAALAPLREALAGDSPEHRAAACRALGAYGLRSAAVPTDLLRRISARVLDDAHVETRFACAFALTRIGPPPAETDDARAIARDLAGGSADDDATVRAMAVRALGRYPDGDPAIVSRRTTDDDWQVAVQAFRSLARLSEARPPVYADALRARVQAVTAEGATLSGPALHVLLTALAVPAALADKEPIHRIAVQAHQHLGRVPEGEPLSRDRGLAHCAAARLLDLGRGWPTRLEECGLEQVPEWERQVAMAEVLGEVDGADAQRLTFLRRLWRGGDPRVQIAVLGAASKLSDPAVAELVLPALRQEHAGVIASACDALGTLIPRFRGAPTEEAAPVLSVRPAGAPEPAAPAPRQAGPTDAQLVRGLRAAHGTLTESDDVEGLQSWLAVVRAASLRRLLEQAEVLARHHNLAVRVKAREVVEALGGTLPTDGFDVIPNAIEGDTLLEGAATAVLQTDRGEVTIALDVARAPTTVARFAGLVREGYFEGLVFHRVVPAFVVQGGDPGGTGYGGPGWTQRCEDNRSSYVRGTVGMALAGRDTGGSQFFIAHGPQPHLDGRYTAFGRVEQGMDVVDRIQVGDRIRSAQIR